MRIHIQLESGELLWVEVETDDVGEINKITVSPNVSEYWTTR